MIRLVLGQEDNSTATAVLSVCSLIYIYKIKKTNKETKKKHLQLQIFIARFEFKQKFLCGQLLL